MRKLCLTLGVLAALGLAVPAARAQSQPTKRQQENLAIFARLYGYVRYFHPSDEAAAADWNSLAILGSERVLAARTDAELQTTLLGLFRPLAPTLQLVPADKVYTFKKEDITPPSLTGYQPISWQHQGYGQGNPQSPYHSQRTHRPATTLTQAATGSRFGTLTKGLNATPYRGRLFRYVATVRNAQPNQAPGALWARVDLDKREMGFFDNMNDRPILRGEWAEYTISGRIDQRAEALSVGAMLLGDGELQVDKLRVEVQDSGRWKTIFADNFEADTTGRYPRSINPRPGSYATANGFSYLVQEGAAAEGSKYVAIKGKYQPPATLPAKEPAEAPPLYARQAAIGEVVQEDIGSNLRCVLPLTLYGTKTTTYPAADPAAGQRLRQELARVAGSEQTGDVRAVRLADVIIAWNIFQHFYPYFATTKSDWPAALPEYLQAAYPAQAGADFALVLRRLVARLNDGHGYVGYAGPQPRLQQLPLRWEWVQGKLAITQVLGDSVPVRPGDVVTAINGEDPGRYFERAGQSVSAATPGYLRYRTAGETLSGPAGSGLRVQVQPASGTTRNLVLHYSLNGQSFSAESTPAEPYRQLSPGVYYLNLDQLPMDKITPHLDELAGAQAIICDLRGYPRSNHELLSHLLTRPDTATHWMRVPRFIYPNQKQVASYGYFGWEMKPKAPHLAARVVFITDSRAISYAESVMGLVKGYHLATIVGQPTAGTNGNVNPFTLPGRYTVRWTGMEVRRLDGQPHHGVGVLPDVPAERTLEGVRAGRDELLEKAIEVATGQH
jgi:C-terminal processing protease CtpA/Prc